eukprot:TRINITY_DN1727_c0_g1_i1.p1 TRINITY_DN1727_c0_g1~~TRINITY_DN1727_c0_g1_i1.p1  ORF type:complete len:239 (+),score=54.30 TRINITY_DN1727_c0_g1_i1:304-1020(+)
MHWRDPKKIGGSTLDWVMNTFPKFEGDYEALGDFIERKLVEQRENSYNNVSEQVIFVPAFDGLYAPFWEDKARASFVGITMDTTADDLAFAVLQSVALITTEMYTAMELDYQTNENAKEEEEEKEDDDGDDNEKLGKGRRQLKVCGGLTNNSPFLQMLADTLQADIIRPKHTEMTALGAAYLAGLAAGVWEDVDTLIISNIKGSSQNVWIPQQSEQYQQVLLRHWNKATASALHWSRS